MTVTASVSGSPLTRSETATAELSPSSARRRSSSAAPSPRVGSSSSIGSLLHNSATSWCIYPGGAVVHNRHLENKRCPWGESSANLCIRVREMFLLRLLYKPFAIIGGIIAGKLGRSVFRSLWAKIDHEPPP